MSACQRKGTCGTESTGSKPWFCKHRTEGLQVRDLLKIYSAEYQRVLSGELNVNRSHNILTSREENGERIAP